jgi:hypothetical protein
MNTRLAIRAALLGLTLAAALLCAGAGPSSPLFSQSETPQAYLPLVVRPLVTATPTPTPTPTPPPTATATATATPGPAPTPTATALPGSNRSLRFYGNGVAAPGLDRVEIALGNPARPVNIGNQDFTIEFWMKADLNDNGNGHQCSANSDDWINAHIIIDRDVFNAGDYGDYGISLASGRIAFGVNNSSTGVTLCGTSNVADGAWHHIAVQRRRSDGQLWLYVDGVEQASATGPTGRVDYRVGRSGAPADPLLVFGAEKHDAGSNYPSYSGFLDEVRLSNVLRYSGNFTRPSGPFSPDANTMALYHFNESSGTTILDSSGATGGPSNGTMRVGGSPAGPVRTSDVPW